MHTPVRKIGIGYSGSLRGAFPSRKNGRVVRTESALERSFCLLLEFDSRVRAYGEQPVTIPFTSRGDKVLRHYTPDFLVEYQEGASCSAVLAEIKYEADLRLKAAELAPKFEAARSYAGERGWDFRIYTEVDIVKTPLLGNARLLLRYQLLPALSSSTEVDPTEVLVALLANVRSSTPTLLTTLGAQHTGLSVATLLPYCWHLLSCGRIGCALTTEPLTMNSQLWAL
ncbi:MAG: TnsA endonuclease N-terminal domain-containing protein [Janthinobacterium lividum]